MHPFEKSGLGKAPFRFCFVAVIPSPSLAGSNPEAYRQGMAELPRDVGCGTCQHCGMGIMNNFIIESSDGIRSAVGCDCILKLNYSDAALVKAAKAERSKMQRAQRQARKEAEVGPDGLTRKQRSEKWAAERAAANEARVAEQRARLEAREAEKQRVRETSRHLGEVGQRIHLKLTYDQSFDYSGTFGTYYIQLFKDEHGNVVVYKGGSPLRLKKGDTCNVTATVKKHDRYQGTAQTVISRMKES